MCQTVQLSGPGKLIVSSTDTSQSTARILKSHAEVVVDSKAVILVCTRNSWGKRCYHVNDQVEVKIKNPVGKELDMALEDEHNGRYKVYFTPKFVGQYDVTINVNGQPLTNLPRSVQVTPHQYQIQYHEEEEISSWRSLFYVENVHPPLDISISQVNGNIAILNECSAIELYDANGRYLCCFGKKNSTEVRAKRLKFPKSVTFSASGYIVVIDYDTITICTEEGIFLWYFTKHIKHPLSVSVTCDGCFIVCDRHDARIKVLSPDGEELLRCFGDPDLNGPPSFAIHHQDRFFVSYCEEHCVSVFNNEGTFLYSIGTLERGEKNLNGPLGLAVDKFNNLIVCDSNASRLQVFTLEGKYVTTITGFGSPQFVAISKDGQLFVADKEKKCVHVLH